MLAIIAMPMMSRLYAPSDFGFLALFLAISSIVATAITMCYETSILLPKDEKESVALVLLSFSLAVVLGLLLALIACFFPEPIKRMFGISTLGFWLPIAVLSGIPTALVAIGTVWLNRQRAYIKMTQLRIMQSSIVAIGGIAFGLYGYNSGLLITQILSPLLVMVVLLVSLHSIRTQSNKQAILSVARKYRAAPKYLLPTALLDVITLQLPVILITAWFSNETAGQFSMAWRITALPMGLIGGAVGQVFLQRFSKLWPDARLARQLLFRTWKGLFLVGVLPTILIMVFGEQLFSWMLGSAWGGAGKIAGIIAPMLFAMLVSSPTSGTFLVLGLQQYSLIFGLAFLVYRTGCIYFGVVSNNVLYGLAAWVICELAAISVYNFIVLKKVNK